MKYDILILSKNDDFNKIVFLLKSIKDNIKGYDSIYLITPERLDIEGVINLTDFEVINEKYKVDLKYRPNWIFQQYIKLLQDVTKNDHYLVIDSDIYINRNIDIFINGKPNFFITRDQYHQPYFNFMKEFNLLKLYNTSFISEMMVFSKSKIRQFLNKNELTVEGFLKKSNQIINQDCYISEFEFYGNMILKEFPDDYNFTKLSTNLAGKHGKWSDSEIEFLINSNKNLDIISYHTWE